MEPSPLPENSDAHAVEAWARTHVAPSAFARRRHPGDTEPLLRSLLRAGGAQWLHRFGWRGFAHRLAALGRGADDLGFGTAALLPNLVAMQLDRYARTAAAQKAAQKAREGEWIVSFAFSEPAEGRAVAHPAHLRTQVAVEGDAWRLNGEKTYLTNGAIADAFVVVAVSGETAEEGKTRKAMEACLVERFAQGVAVEEIALPICPTVTHAKLQLADVTISPDARFGSSGDAFVELVRPFRALEDMALAGLLLGHLQGLTRDAAHASDEVRGRLRSLLTALSLLLDNAAATMDAEEDATALRLAMPYLIDPAIALVQEHAHPDNEGWNARVFDLQAATLGANARRRFWQKLGAALP